MAIGRSRRNAVIANEPKTPQGLGLTDSDLLRLFESSPYPQFLVLPDPPVYTIAAVSDELLRVSVRERHQVVGRGVFDVYPENPDDPEASGQRNLRASLDRVLSSRFPDKLLRQRYDVRERGGRYRERYWDGLSTPIFRSDGSIAHILHSAEDVTELVMERKRTLETRRELELVRRRSDEQSVRRAQRAGRVGSFEWFLKEGRAVWTPELAELYGVDEGVLQTGLESWSRLVVPEDAEHVRSILSEAMAQHLPDCIYEFRVMLPDGKLRWLRGQASFHYDEMGAPERMLGVNIDIDAQKLAEDKLRESEQRLRAIFNGTFEYIGLVAPDGTLLEVNRAALEFAGNAREELLGKAFWEMPWFTHTPGMPERVKASVARAGRGEFVRFEERLSRPTGETRTFDIALHPVRNQQGEIVLIVPEGRDITERKKAEEDLLQQWQSFDSALSHLADHIYTFDLEGRLLYANRSLLSQWNKSLPEVFGTRQWEERYPAWLAAQLRQEMAQVIGSGQPLRNDTEVEMPDGEARRLEYIFVPVMGPDGKVRAVAGSTRDITERVRADELVKEDRRQWRELLRQAPAGIALLKGPEHRFEWANENCGRMVNRNENEMVGRTVLEVLPESATQPFLAMLDEVYRTGVPAAGHEKLFQVRRDEGRFEDLYVNFVFFANRDLAGRIDGVFVHAVDVTDTVVIRRHLEESERQFRTLADAMPNLAWMANPSGHIFWYNRRWYEFTGTTLEQAEGWQWQNVHDPAILPKVMERWQEAIATGQTFEMTFPLRGANGEYRSFLTRAEPLKDEQGKVVRWFGTNTDITRQLETERELRRMNGELEEFAFVASHDLQEPLRMVSIYTQLLMRKMPEGSEDAPRYAQFIRQGVGRMDLLLRDLLTFSRTVHMDQALEEEGDLEAALDEALDLLRPQIDESQAAIEREALPKVPGETSQFTHVFQNLVSNALKYRRTGERPRIRITAARQDGNWVIAVADNGIGFEPEYAEHVFGLFKRLHKNEYPGTGLGLAICRRIIERYGGRIWAESALGKGSMFRFSLPISRH